MKIERTKGKEFEPFKILIETEEEALVLFHRLNVSKTKVDEYYKTSGYINKERGDINYNLWKVINEELELQRIKPER